MMILDFFVSNASGRGVHVPRGSYFNNGTILGDAGAS